MPVSSQIISLDPLALYARHTEQGTRANTAFFHHPELGVTVGIVQAERLANYSPRHAEDSVFAYLREVLAEIPAAELPFFNNGLIGLFGYELIHHLETFPHPRSAQPDYYLLQPTAFFVYEAKTQRLSVYGMSLAALVADVAEPLTPGTYQFSDVNTDTPQEVFCEKVQQIQAAINRGDVFQAVLSRSVSGRFTGSTLALLQTLAAQNPSAYVFYLVMEHGSVVLGASPEQAVSVTQTAQCLTASIEPIAGTRPTHRDPRVQERLTIALKCDPKELSEHAMLIDLARNDLSRVCRPGSVQVSDSFKLKPLAQVQHLVSTVTGSVAPGFDALDVYQASMNMGTLTGAPKVAAMSLLAELETTPRGFFGGAFGALTKAGELHSCIVIRTIMIANGIATLRAGAGIVADSVPLLEFAETEHKMRGCLQALQAGAAPAPATAPQAKGVAAAPSPSVPVLVIDHFDSFTHNLVHAFAVKGCAVDVLRSNVTVATVLAAIAQKHYALIVFSPGPYHPRDATLCQQLLKVLPESQAILGVCLGHQCLVESFGGEVTRAPSLAHGKLNMIHHSGTHVFQGLPSPLQVGRYHSLAGSMIPPCFEVLAHSEDGAVMAIAHKNRPIWGVQFHPESVLTPLGDSMIDNVLTTLISASMREGVK